MKRLLVISVLLISSLAHAKWVVKNQFANIDTTDPHGIIRSFEWANEGFDQLNSINLVSSHKIL